MKKPQTLWACGVELVYWVSWQCRKEPLFLILRKSQNSWGWKGALEIISAALLKAGCSVRVRSCSEQLQDTTTPWASGSSAWPSLQGRFFTYLNGISCVSACAIASCPVSGHCWEKSGSILLTASHQVLIHSNKIPLNRIFSKLRNPSPPSLSLYVRWSRPLGLCGPSLDVFSYVRVWFFTRDPSTGHSTPCVGSLMPNRGEQSPPSTCNLSPSNYSKY